jgi:hypothetical protein
LVVAVLAVVHDAADGGPGGGRNLDEIEAEVSGLGEGVVGGDDAELVAVGADEPDFGYADALVDAGAERPVARIAGV